MRFSAAALALVLPLLVVAAPALEPRHDNHPPGCPAPPKTKTTTTTYPTPTTTVHPTTTVKPTTTTTTTTSSSTSTSSSPPQPTVSNFSVIAARSGSPIHLQSVNANGQAFWIGKTTASYCPTPPVPASSCPAGTVTAFGIFEQGQGASLDTAVPGGQQVYVQATGELGFTQAHSALVPAGAYRVGFSATAPGANGLGDFGFSIAGKAAGWLACPATKGAFPYQIFADVPGLKVPSGNVDDCYGFDALTSNFAGGAAAWQYT